MYNRPLRVKLLDAKIVDLTEDEGEPADELEQADACREELYGAPLQVERFLKTTPVMTLPLQLQLERYQLTPVLAGSGCQQAYGQLLQVETVTCSQNTKALCKLLDRVSCHIHSPQSLGMSQESCGNLVSSTGG